MRKLAIVLAVAALPLLGACGASSPQDCERAMNAAVDRLVVDLAAGKATDKDVPTPAVCKGLSSAKQEEIGTKVLGARMSEITSAAFASAFAGSDDDIIVPE